MNAATVSDQQISAKAITALDRAASRWPDGVPGGYVMDGHQPVKLDATAQRKLGANALAVWEHLVNERRDGDRPMDISCERLKADLGLSSAKVAEKALDRLQKANLVDKWTHAQRGPGPNQWVSRMQVRVFGAITVDNDEKTLWVPEPALAWIKSRGHGGARKGAGRPAEWCGDIKLNPLPPKFKMGNRALGPAKQRTTNQALRNQVGGPMISTLKSGEHPSFLTEKKPLPGRGNFLPVQKGLQRPFQIDSASLPRQAVGGTRLTGNPSDRHTRHQWVRLVVAAYNTACGTVYGRRGRVRAPAPPELAFCTWNAATGPTEAFSSMDDGGAMEHWKHYAKLEAAALLMHEHGISPQAFAEWAMEQATEQDVKRGKRAPKPRSIVATFSVKTLRQKLDIKTWNAKGELQVKPTRLGMFMQANSGNTGHEVQPQRVHHEQLHRMQEAAQRRRGIDYLIMFPPWYVQMREAEIAAGLLDPTKCFPTARKEQ